MIRAVIDTNVLVSGLLTPTGNAALIILAIHQGFLQPIGPCPTLPDAGDGKFLHCAEASQAEYIVTGNKRHFPQAVCGTVLVVNASELLDRITLEIRP